MKNEKTKAVALLERLIIGGPSFEKCKPVKKDAPNKFKPFTSEGFVSLPGDDIKKQLGRLLLRSVLPLTEELKSKNSALLRGVQMTWFRDPVVIVYFDSDIVNGPVDAAVRDGLPVEGNSFLLGNDLAGVKSHQTSL